MTAGSLEVTQLAPVSEVLYDSERVSWMTGAGVAMQLMTVRLAGLDLGVCFSLFLFNLGLIDMEDGGQSS